MGNAFVSTGGERGCCCTGVVGEDGGMSTNGRVAGVIGVCSEDPGSGVSVDTDE